ncbi:hypothetical protein H1R20_g1699, partial [Candolleomyces eurysporus]
MAVQHVSLWQVDLAQLLLCIYGPIKRGYVSLEKQDVLFLSLDEDWVRRNTSPIILLRGRKHKRASCSSEPFKFIKDFPRGCEAAVGGFAGGVGLGDGQHQPSAFSRARQVLVIDEATSTPAVSATSHLVAFGAPKQEEAQDHSRPPQITAEAFVYALRSSN